MTESEQPEQETQPSRWLALAEESYKYLEAYTVLGIVALATASSFYEVVWIFTGGTWSDAHARFWSAITQLDSHWRLGLALLIPLFYRTVRQFLEEAENLLGVNRMRGKASQEETLPEKKA